MTQQLGYVRPVANHQDFDVYSEVHTESGKELNVCCVTAVPDPQFEGWDRGKIAFNRYQNPEEFIKSGYYQILDVCEFYRPESIDVLQNFPGKKTVTVFDNLPFGISDGRSGELSFLADKVIARTPMIKRMLELEGVPSSKISIVPSAVDTKLFRPGIFGGLNPTVLFVGRLAPAKGLWDLIVALSGLDIELTVAGEGDKEPYELLASKCGVPTRFLGKCEHKNLPKLYHQASIVVVPSIPAINIQNAHGSWVEQFGVVILEAMACGIPVIASQTGSTQDIVGDAGLLFPPRSWDVLRYHIQTLCGNYAMRNKMGAAGRDRAERLFSTKVVGKQLAKLYGEL